MKHSECFLRLIERCGGYEFVRACRDDDLYPIIMAEEGSGAP